MGARDIVPVVCTIVLSKGGESFMSDLAKAASRLIRLTTSTQLKHSSIQGIGQIWKSLIKKHLTAMKGHKFDLLGELKYRNALDPNNYSPSRNSIGRMLSFFKNKPRLQPCHKFSVKEHLK